MKTRVSELYIYPLKSAGGIRVSSAHVTRRGFENDRRWMLLSEDGAFVSARTLRALVALRVKDEGRHWSIRSENNSLVVELPKAFDTTNETVWGTIWGDRVELLEHEMASRAFSMHFHRSLRCVYQPESSVRPVEQGFSKPSDQVSLADGYPYLMISDASLASLNARLDSVVDMRRFRPNIVVSGLAAHAEDDLRHFTLGNVPFRGGKPCARCVMVTLDPDANGTVSKEPLRTLNTYRKHESGVIFGANLIADVDSAMIHVGDLLRETHTE